MAQTGRRPTRKIKAQRIVRLLFRDDRGYHGDERQSEDPVHRMDLFKQLNNEGVTIIQVTHSEKNASYGSHVIHLLDGRIEKQ